MDQRITIAGLLGLVLLLSYGCLTVNVQAPANSLNVSMNGTTPANLTIPAAPNLTLNTTINETDSTLSNTTNSS